MEKSNRKINKFPLRMHNYIVCGIVECVNITLDRGIAKSQTYCNVINYNNMTVTSLINTFINCASSIFAYKLYHTINILAKIFKTLISNIYKCRNKYY